MYRPVGCLTKSKSLQLLAEFKVNCNFYGKCDALWYIFHMQQTKVNANSLPNWTVAGCRSVLHLMTPIGIGYQPQNVVEKLNEWECSSAWFLISCKLLLNRKRSLWRIIYLLFQSDDDLKQTFTRNCYGNLCLLELWIYRFLVALALASIPYPIELP